MSCYGEYNDHTVEEREALYVSNCKECGSELDKDGKTTELCCSYSPICELCGYAPCDHSC